jgi:hypothetical protein
MYVYCRWALIHTDKNDLATNCDDTAEEKGKEKHHIWFSDRLPLIFANVRYLVIHMHMHMHILGFF